MFILIKNVEKPKLPKLIWALRKQFGLETLVWVQLSMPHNCRFFSTGKGALCWKALDNFPLSSSQTRLGCYHMSIDH